MRTIVFLFTTAITANLFGQDKMEATSNVESAKIQIGVNFSPDYCFRTLKNNDGSSSSDFVLKWRNENETSKLGYTTGLKIIFNLNKNIGIGAGIQYSNKGYQINMQDLTYGSMVDPRTGFAYNTPGSKITSAKFIYNYYYIDVPLNVNFSFGKKKIRFVTSAGFSTNVFIKETTTSIFEYDNGAHDKNTQPTTYTYNTVNVSPFVSAGIDWRFSSRNNFRIEPTIRYGVLKIIKAPVTGYLWNAGLNISYFFGLK